MVFFLEKLAFIFHFFNSILHRASSMSSSWKKTQKCIIYI